MRTLSSLIAIFISFPTLAIDNFITREGHTLFDGEKEFRFAGIHAPELHRIENDVLGKCVKDPRGWGQYFKWPTADEQENWIKALTKTGHKAMRIYVLSVAQEFDEMCDRETHVLAPKKIADMPTLNEKAMVVYDRMIALASKHNLRLILPFIDHWEWWGGRKQLAALYNESEDDFYNVESKTYQAYLSIITDVVSRKNTITGRHYYEEKAIMAWETGNELRDTNKSFLNATVAHIRALTPSQLIIDGTYIRINDYALENPDVDIISNHYYTNVGNNHPKTIKEDLKTINGKKAYLLGEFGLIPWQELDEIMQTALHYDYKGAKTVGAFIWGFRGNRHDGGFYFHQEYTGHYSYRIPGFKEADKNEEIAVVNIVRTAIAQLQGQTNIIPLPVPEAPKLRNILSSVDIRWMGSPTGRTYRVERATDENGPWETIGDNISAGKIEFNPKTDTLFSDPEKLTKYQTYYYRVFAKNETGESEASNVKIFVP